MNQTFILLFAVYTRSAFPQVEPDTIKEIKAVIIDAESWPEAVERLEYERLKLASALKTEQVFCIQISAGA